MSSGNMKIIIWHLPVSFPSKSILLFFIGWKIQGSHQVYFLELKAKNAEYERTQLVNCVVYSVLNIRAPYFTF